MTNPMNSRLTLLAKAIMFGLILTINVAAAQKPYVDQISRKVQVAIQPERFGPPLRSLLHEVDTEKTLDDQFDGYEIFDGDVSVVILENWKSAASYFDNRHKKLKAELLELDAAALLFTVVAKIKGPNGIRPYMIIVINWEAFTDDISEECLAKNVLDLISVVHEASKFQIKKCSAVMQ